MGEQFVSGPAGGGGGYIPYCPSPRGPGHHENRRQRRDHEHLVGRHHHPHTRVAQGNHPLPGRGGAGAGQLPTGIILMVVLLGTLSFALAVLINVFASLAMRFLAGAATYGDLLWGAVGLVCLLLLALVVAMLCANPRGE